MEKIRICATQKIEYGIESRDSLEKLAAGVASFADSSAMSIFVDQGLPSNHANAFMAALRFAGVSVRCFPVHGNEEQKTLDNALQIAAALNRSGTKRRSAPPVVIGGGVACDVVGFACSLYRRGIPFIRVPTTLLGMVDVSVAAKTAVNHFGYRNRLGSFHPAVATYLYPGFLDTLSDRHIANGLAEVFKIALIKSRRLLDLLDAHGHAFFEPSIDSNPFVREIIHLAAAAMAEELESNLWEHDLCRVVDYGHSFSPLIEMTYVDELLHGEAVAVDCLYSVLLSRQRGMLNEADVARIFDIARRLRLPIYHRGFGNGQLVADALRDTMIHRDGNQNLPLMHGLGDAVFVNDLTPAEMCKASEALSRISSAARIAGFPAEAYAT
ncbi:sedoheptulose 7-phosphate cyclase [Burkholderia seminalis]|uniref:sedoheptulose 7-phosphate cyclase n=1 Tax=Burkholderia seminalis TaxID=488731 RepID=UPI00158EE038|nr:sedoheptulose 7-phosphate cyclase [Burkholderia seminalis]